MPKQVVELLACWHRGVGQHRPASVWGVVQVYYVENMVGTEY